MGSFPPLLQFSFIFPTTREARDPTENETTEKRFLFLAVEAEHFTGPPFLCRSIYLSHDPTNDLNKNKNKNQSCREAHKNHMVFGMKLTVGKQRRQIIRPERRSRRKLSRSETHLHLTWIAKHCIRIERLNKTNPTSPSSLNYDIIKIFKCPVNSPRSRGSISAVYSNHSQHTLDLHPIY
ncbi:hypothetical protein M5K25_028163 [Dendrobium thyrsiflorum]|uniref:Uncharacterized protein n=1 Tax=Dendrobium thyrsiflorum TaxID=117978 RepID=A0ABD0TVN0_DENTH